MKKSNIVGSVVETGNEVIEVINQGMPAWFVLAMGATFLGVMSFCVVEAIFQGLASMEHSVLCASFSR